MLGRDRLCVAVWLGRWRSSARPGSADDLSRPGKELAPEKPGSVRKSAERVAAFLGLKIPILAGKLASEPNYAGAGITGSVAADVGKPQLAPVLGDDPAGEIGRDPF